MGKEHWMEFTNFAFNIIKQKGMQNIKGNSPYTAAFTGCSFMMYEMIRMLPLFFADNADELIKKEIEENRYMMVNSITSRKRYCHELKRRFDAVPRSFWNDFLEWDEPAQRLGIFYVLLNSYRIVLEFHLNVTVKKWKSINHAVGLDDITMELSQIAAQDEFVDSWSDGTKKKVASSYLTFLNQAGMYDKKSQELHPVSGIEMAMYTYYVKIGQDWFLEACLLYPYEIEKVKQESL